MAFTVTMDHAADHSYHVAFRCDGLTGATQDFTMPVWTPGYYRVMDYERHVSHFAARDGDGRSLPWEKVTKNTWRVAGAPSITVEYDVFANTVFGAQNYLDPGRGYISPPGLYLYVAGQLRHPVTVNLAIPASWQHIATGLDPVPGEPHTYSAPDFDIFYDCPTLMGNQEALRFDVRGVPHYVAIENVPAEADRPQILSDLKRIVEAATGMIGEIPYTHYTFLLMGTGNGGIEHLNSASISFNGKSITTENGYRGWLSYVAHEYFHNFNVKRIRPLALGPFDYETENLTNMLWVSEGISVYYQDLLLVRAGLVTREQYLDKMAAAMSRFETSGGHRYQSASESSLHTWNAPFAGNNTSISYYENGGMLGAMLDLAIRHQSGNARSLDDVMRTLYRKYYKEWKRGFTDAEFRQECETAAGAPLDEVFSYASTTNDVDYAKYFAYAGLAVSVAEQEAPGGFLGLNTQTEDGKMMVAGVTAESPAEAAGLAAGDELVEADGVKATPRGMADLLAAKKPGDRLKLQVVRGGATREVEAVLAKNTKRTFGLTPAPQANRLQEKILDDWLRSL